MTYKEIEEYLESHGTKVSVTLIRDICKKMYGKNGKEDHRATHKRKEKNNMEKNESSEDLNKKLREKLKIKLEMENNPKAVTEKDSCKSERVENGIER